MIVAECGIDYEGLTTSADLDFTERSWLAE